jgi:chromosome segregation ATPase
VAVQARLEGLDGQHKAAVEQIQGAHQEQVLALRAGLSEAREQAEQARHELAVAKARHEADLALLRGELDRQVSQLADLRAALQMRPPVPAPLVVAADQKAPDQSAS